MFKFYSCQIESQESSFDLNCQIRPEKRQNNLQCQQDPDIIFYRRCIGMLQHHLQQQHLQAQQQSFAGGGSGEGAGGSDLTLEGHHGGGHSEDFRSNSIAVLRAKAQQHSARLHADTKPALAQQIL